MGTAFGKDNEGESGWDSEIKNSEDEENKVSGDGATEGEQREQRERG